MRLRFLGRFWFVEEVSLSEALLRRIPFLNRTANSSVNLFPAPGLSLCAGACRFVHLPKLFDKRLYPRIAERDAKFPFVSVVVNSLNESLTLATLRSAA